MRGTGSVAALSPPKYGSADEKRPHAVEQGFVKFGRRLDLRHIAQIGELDQVRMRDACRRFLSQHGILAERGADNGWRQVFPIAVVSLSPRFAGGNGWRKSGCRSALIFFASTVLMT